MRYFIPYEQATDTKKPLYKITLVRFKTAVAKNNPV